MKAVCLLVCLALARQSAGSIFQRPHSPSMERFARFENVEPYLQEEEYQQQQNQYQRYPEQQYKNQEYQNQQYQNQEYQNQQYQNQEYLQNKEAQKLHQNQYRQAQNQDYQQQYKHQRPQYQNIRRYADSSESQSQETIPALTGRQYEQQYAFPRFADLNTPVIAARTSDVPAVYGDAVVWRGLEVAAGPNDPISKKDIESTFREAELSTKNIQPEQMLKLHAEVVAAQTNNEDAHLNATELLKKYQYPVEEHTVKTDDGYYLTIFHISPKQKSSEDKPRKVVFLMHGLLGSADDWLMMGPSKSLAYALSDAGYEVYLGNARGNKYTHHATKSRSQPDFWQYSNDEIALYDLPAMIDYVLKESKHQKIYYVGQSQGTTAFFALAAARPEYNEKIAMMFAISPMVYMNKVRSPLIRMMAPSNKFHDRLTSQLGNAEFKPQAEVVHTIGGNMCEKQIGCKGICSNVYFVMAGLNPQNLDPAHIPTILKHLPAGASTKQMQQYGQAVDSQEFRMFDYGAEMNKQVYGQSEPPKYEMEKVTAPVVLYYSNDDWMAHPTDVQRLENELPNVSSHKINEDYFSHTDFQYSKQATEVVNKNLIQAIENEQNNKQQNHKQQNHKQQNKKQQKNKQHEKQEQSNEQPAY